MDNTTITKPMFVGKSKAAGCHVYIRPYNKFGDIVVSLKTQNGFSDYPMHGRPQVFKHDQHTKAVTVARKLQSTL